ncbi:MAG TPA: asparagine synthase-related protein [Thermoanaerobaculia bacterium]|jgi:asparagine synthase (glutamine-hydrolysing)
MADRTIARVVDLTDPSTQRIPNGSVAQARDSVASGDPRRVLAIPGSFALVARDAGSATVRMARSLDRPLRYFLAKQTDGPMLVVAERIDAIRAFLDAEGLGAQFHPSYTRMVPAHHVVTLELLGCPDPDAAYTRFLEPEPSDATDLDAIGRRYVGALADEIALWLTSLPPDAPIGVCFSGGIDSGAVFLTTHHLVRRLGVSPARLKAFTLSAGASTGPDLAQARDFLESLSLGLFLEAIEVPADWIDPLAAVRVVEDYKPLDVESAAASLALLRGIRERYPDWRHLADGDGGDENLKDYPIEENPELTIRSVVNNPFLYQEGWGVGTFKHSPTYSGGQSRACTRTYAPARRYGFEGFSPFTRPSLVRIAAGLPFAGLAGNDVARLYALKGEIVGRGIRDLTGLTMPIFPKRRFQHGARATATASRPGSPGEPEYRRHFLSLYA